MFYDSQEVKRIVTGHWASVHFRLCGISDESLTGKHGPCPKHGGTDKWRTFDDYEKTGGAVCNECGKMADGFEVIQRHLGCSFIESLKLVAECLGVPPKSNQDHEPKELLDPAKNLELLGRNEAMFKIFCMKKKGITPDAIGLVGGLYAMYRKKHPVIAIPARGKDGETVGYCMYGATGKELPVWEKRNKDPIEWKKIKVTAGSKPGWVGTDRPAEPKVGWKPEGLSCTLALISLGLPEGHFASCNLFGAEEDPASSPWMLERYRDIPEVFVVHDCDKPGQSGALFVSNGSKTRPGWAPALANVAGRVRNFVPPYPMADTHGKDMRDLIIQRLEANNQREEVYQQLMESARRADKIEPVELKAAPALKNVEVADHDSEFIDDPHRLARVNLKKYEQEFKRTLKYWKQTFYSWQDGVYEELSNDHFEKRLNRSIHDEFKEACQSELDKYITWRLSKHFDESKDRGAPKIRKFGEALVKNTVAATASMKEVHLDQSQKMHAWTDDKQNKDWFMAVGNGILNTTKATTLPPPPDSEILLPHSPKWFSTTKLNFNFDPLAECPTWAEFLKGCFNSDPDSLDLLQKWFGYLLTPDTSLQKILMVIGEKRCGKGTIIKIMNELFGTSNIATPTLGELSREFSLATLVGKTVAIIPDARLSDRADEVTITERLLSISGGDPQNVSRKYKDTLAAFDLKVRFTLFSNMLPRIKDPSAAFLSRCLFLRMPNSHLGKEDYELFDKLSAELPGILNWAIAGRHMLNTASHPKIAEPKMARQTRNEMQSIISSVYQFVMDECALGGGKECDTRYLFEVWEKWCNENDVSDAGTIQSFSRKLKAINSAIDTVQYMHGGDRRRRFVGIDHKSTF